MSFKKVDDEAAPVGAYIDPAACRGFEKTVPEPRFPRAGLRLRADGAWQLMLWDADGIPFTDLIWVSWKNRASALEYACWAVQQHRTTD